jgi:peptidoglycan/LPS O-acetylase OafA/YrhL
MLSSEAEPRIPALDGLRGLAAWIVVLSHVSNTTGLLDRLFGVGGGQLGVMLFFVLSGYLMGALYLDRPFRPAAIREYVVRRLARVAPLYYAIVVLSFVLALFGLTLYPIDLGNIAPHLLLISGVSVLWTIPVEIHFYVLFVGLWWLRARSPEALLLTLCVVVITCFLVQMKADRFATWLPFFIHYFVAGLLITRLPRLAAPAWAWNVLFVVSLALMILLYPQVYIRIFGEQRWLLSVHLLQMWHDPLYLVAIVGLLIAGMNAPLAQTVLSSRPMIAAGATSYAVYLLHMPIITCTARLPWVSTSPFAVLVISAALTIAISTAAHLILERPARRLIRSRFEKNRDPELAPA